MLEKKGMQKPHIKDGRPVQPEVLLHCTVSVYTEQICIFICESEWERVIATDWMTNWSTCCLTQTSLFCLQKTVGICQANKENITFRVAHKTWNAIYCKGSFQNTAVLAVRGIEQRAWSPPVSSKPLAQREDCTPSPVRSKTQSRAGKGNLSALICRTLEMLKCKKLSASH